MLTSQNVFVVMLLSDLLDYFPITKIWHFLKTLDLFQFIKEKNAAAEDEQRPSSSMMGYSPIAKKSPIDQMGKNIWGKLMVFFPIRSIYLNGTN